MNREAKDVPTKLWRRISSSSPNRRSSCEIDMINIKLRKMAIDLLEWHHDEVRFAIEGKLLFTQPNDNNWRKGRTIKLTPVNALLVTNGKVCIFKFGLRESKNWLKIRFFTANCYIQSWKSVKWTAQFSTAHWHTRSIPTACEREVWQVHSVEGTTIPGPMHCVYGSRLGRLLWSAGDLIERYIYF